MRRFATFILLGPFLAWLTFMILLVPDLIRRPDPPMAAFGIALLGVAAVGFLPAIGLAWADQQMAHFRLSRVVRAVACAVLAYPAAVLALWIVLGQPGASSSDTAELPVAGLYAMIPAAVCPGCRTRRQGSDIARPDGLPKAKPHHVRWHLRPAALAILCLPAEGQRIAERWRRRDAACAPELLPPGLIAGW